MNKEIIIQQLDSLMIFLEQHFALASCHTVDYFTKKLYEKCIPLIIQQEISNSGLPHIITGVFEDRLDSSLTPNLCNFINKSKSNSLYNSRNICIPYTEFQQKLVELTNNESYRNSIKLKVFITEKKSHEIELMSNICAALNELAKTSHVVDLGDGKGYLSSTLALHYKIKVLGIEGSEIKTEGAVKRAEKLGKVWNSLPTNPNQTVLPLNKRERSISDYGSYKQITKYVTEETDIKSLVQNVFLDEVNDIGLVGLHTCGNLTPTSLKMYAFNDALKSLCNVGCCYHLMNEYFENVNFNANTSHAFPISDYLKRKQFSLGRQARMLAAQTIDRMLSKKNLPTKTTFFRALLEILLVEHFGEHCKGRNIGRLKKECSSFVEYSKIASSRLAINLKKSDTELNEFYMKYASRFEELNIFYLLRSLLAPTVESIILLDRLLFLLESGYSNSYLVNLFNPVISPRCYAIISYK